MKETIPTKWYNKKKRAIKFYSAEQTSVNVQIANAHGNFSTFSQSTFLDMQSGLLAADISQQILFSQGRPGVPVFPKQVLPRRDS